MQKTSGRLLSLLSLLQARRDWPGAALAERLDISARTVRRDVDRLRELGYPITTFKGPDGGYRLDAGSELPPLLFDDDQAIALSVALSLATTSGVGIEESALRALNTVRQVMPARLRRRIDTFDVTAVRTTDNRPQVDTSVLTTIGGAVHARETLRFDYEPAGSPPRRAEPHHLVTRSGYWYLVAWDLDREDWRTFRVDRITPRIPNGPRFDHREIPGGDVAAFVAGRFRGRDGAGDWACRGTVTLDLPASDVTPYSGDGVVESVGDERCRLSLGAWTWTALAAAYGRFDTDMHDAEPMELVDAFADVAHRYARAAGVTDGNAVRSKGVTG